MRDYARAALCGLAFLIFGTTGAFAQGAGAQHPAPAAAASVDEAMKADASAQTYILGPSDVIEVSVLSHPDYTTKGRIEDNGTFRLPFIGTVTAANKTTIQLADDIARALAAGGYFNAPIVRVDVSSFASRYVTVLGNVRSPGLIPVDRAYRLSEIIARVGGVTEAGADYVVYRPRTGESRRIKVALLAGGDPNDDPLVTPGDKIYIPEADMLYVSGQVKSPGVFPLKPDMTFRMAVARAGGVTDSGSLKAMTVTRGGKKLSHVSLDAKVEPGDNILIGERLF